MRDKPPDRLEQRSKRPLPSRRVVFRRGGEVPAAPPIPRGHREHLCDDIDLERALELAQAWVACRLCRSKVEEDGDNFALFFVTVSIPRDDRLQAEDEEAPLPRQVPALSCEKPLKGGEEELLSVRRRLLLLPSRRCVRQVSATLCRGVRGGGGGRRSPTSLGGPAFEHIGLSTDI